MPADTKAKISVRKAPYDVLRRSKAFIASPGQPAAITRPLPLGVFWHSSLESERTTDFVSRLSAYLKQKNEAYRKELGSMEEALVKAEEAANNLRERITALGQMTNALEGTLSAAAHTLSASLLCTICFETCMNPTSLKCGHSFCRDCLQPWFLSQFESKCKEVKIELDKTLYSYIYKQNPTASEAERNMFKFAKLSNRINPGYNCPSCRDPLLPSLRNTFLDFKLAASLKTLSTLIGDHPANAPGWRHAGVDFLAFFNSRFFRRHTELSFDDADSDSNVADVDASDDDMPVRMQ